jgi:hypothetical protein
VAESAQASGVALESSRTHGTLHAGHAASSGTPEPAIPSDVLRNWQRIVDLLANIVHVPSAVVTKLEPPDYTYYKIVAANSSSGNPFPVDDVFSMDIGTLCETVIKSREPLLVVNAREDDQWKSAPEIQVVRTAYLGVPIARRYREVFENIFVLYHNAHR